MTQKPNTQSDEANLCNSQSAPSSAHPDTPEGTTNVLSEMILIGNILNSYFPIDRRCAQHTAGAADAEAHLPR